MKVLGIDFIISSVADLDKAKSFYRDVLGIQDPILMESESWTEFDTKPVALALAPAWDIFQPPSTAIALAVDDVEAAVEELRQKGVKVLIEPMESPVCWMAGVADPDGNTIIIHQRKDGTAG